VKIRGNRVLGLCCKLDWQIETQNLLIDPWLNYLPCTWSQLLILISFASNRPLNRPHGANPHLAWMNDYMNYRGYLTECSCESLQLEWEKKTLRSIKIVDLIVQKHFWTFKKWKKRQNHCAPGRCRLPSGILNRRPCTFSAADTVEVILTNNDHQ
jgi:hypothetical protein